MSEEKPVRILGALHRCKICGALWKLNLPSDVQPEGSWSLVSPTCGKCCDNVAMGVQIEPVKDDDAGYCQAGGDYHTEGRDGRCLYCKRSMRKPLVYIAGPFRAPTPWGVECNVREAERAGYALLEASGYGVAPVIPHAMFRYSDKLVPDECMLEVTLAILRKCDAVYLLPGWERSSGTRGELAEAQRLGLIVSEYMADLLARLGAATAKLGVTGG